MSLSECLSDFYIFSCLKTNQMKKIDIKSFFIGVLAMTALTLSINGSSISDAVADSIANRILFCIDGSTINMISGDSGTFTTYCNS